MRNTISKMVLVLIVFAITNLALADEGMWLLNNLPAAELKAKYNFTPTPEWVERVQKSSARLPNCSASFVSADGLIMTNGHCAEDAVQTLSTAKNNLYANGFYARNNTEELKTGLTLMVLNHIDDRTPELAETLTGLKCEPVSLYQGAVTQTYCYKVYDDIRLVFSSEKNTWFFGGDSDNFEFPRYAMDAAFLRAYENGVPAKTPFHFKWSRAGAKEGELIFVSGHPGRTQRLLTSAALEFERDIRVPFMLDMFRRRELTTQQFMLRGKEQTRIAQSDLFSWQNARKLYVGKVRGLQDPRLIADKMAFEQKVVTELGNNAALRQEYSDGQALILQAQQTLTQLYPKIALLLGNLGFDSNLVMDGKVESLEYEEAKLTDSLTHLTEVFGASSLLITELMKCGSGPADIAHKFVRAGEIKASCLGTVLTKDEGVAIKIFSMLKGDWDALAEQQRQGYKKINDVLFALYGTNRYPDATFTLRLSFGTVRGYEENGKQIASTTTLDGAYKHSADFGNQGDWQLPSRWLKRKNAVNLQTPFNFVSDLDITGGNSGSPVFNRNLEIVGLVFDGNIHSLVSDYDYNYSPRARAVSVHSSGIIEVLKKIYRADALVRELTR